MKLIHWGVGALLFSAPFAHAFPIFGLNSIFVLCYSRSAEQEVVTDWAETADGQNLVLSGRWNSGSRSNQFVSHQLLEFELSESCIQTILKNRGSRYRFSDFKAKAYSFGKEYDIVFEINSEKQKLISDSALELDGQTGQEFLALSQKVLNSSSYVNNLSAAVYQYFLLEEEKRNGFEYYLHQAIRFGKSNTENEPSFFSFLDQFKSTSDFEILSYQFESLHEVNRGEFNSFVDLVTDAFQPVEKQMHCHTPHLFDPTRSDHQLTYSWVQAFTLFASLEDIVLKIKKLENQEGSEEVLASFLNFYVREVDRCVKALQDIEKAISSYQTEYSFSDQTIDSWVTSIDALKRKLLKNRNPAKKVLAQFHKYE